jgi:RluA family pseudouridine synthase
MVELVDILYEDADCIVLNKPSALLTQAPRGIDSLEARVREYVRWKYHRTGHIYVGVPHRLDRPASGAIVMGLRLKSTQRLAKQFERREVQKTYWVIVEGLVSPESGTWRDTMRKVPGRAHSEMVTADHPESQTAVLTYRVVARSANTSWLEVELETGRTHQIRLQAAARGYPVVGDTTYGAAGEFGTKEADPRERPIALHSRRLGFRQPKTRDRIEIVAPVPVLWSATGFHVSSSELPKD